LLTILLILLLRFRVISRINYILLQYLAEWVKRLSGVLRIYILIDYWLLRGVECIWIKSQLRAELVELCDWSLTQRCNLGRLLQYLLSTTIVAIAQLHNRAWILQVHKEIRCLIDTASYHWREWLSLWIWIIEAITSICIECWFSLESRVYIASRIVYVETWGNWESVSFVEWLVTKTTSSW